MDMSLRGLTIFLSSSIPEELKNHPDAQEHYSLITTLVREVMTAGGIVVFGGDPSVVRLLDSVVRQLPNAGDLALFQSEQFRDAFQRLHAIKEHALFKKVEWVPKLATVEASLFELRKRMVSRADAAIFAGGKTKGSIGSKPGIRAEYELFTQERPGRPVYLVGMLGGEAAALIREGVPEPNKLTPSEKELVHTSDFIDLIVGKILADLARFQAENQPQRSTRRKLAPGDELESLSRGLDDDLSFGAEPASAPLTPSPQASPPTTVTVRFTYATGVKKPFLTAARLTGSWDPARRPSSTWTSLSMQPVIDTDGCPAFRADVTFPADQVGRSYRWGVLVDGPPGMNVWGILAEIKDVNSSDRYRVFDLLPPAPGGAAQEERYHLSHSRGLGTQKYYDSAKAEPRLRAGVWAPDARAVDLVFGTFWHMKGATQEPTRESVPIGELGGGYIADDDPGTGTDPTLGRIPMRREGPLWFTDPAEERLSSFAALDHRPYMFRVTRDDGKVLHKTDLYSRCQAGQGKEDPSGLPFHGGVIELDGRVSCSIVVNPDTVTKEFHYPVWPEPSDAFISEESFWEAEFDPSRPVPRRLEDLIIYELHIGALGGPNKRENGQLAPGDFKDAIGLLDDLVDLGVNAIELLPMAEFGLGNEAWGYGNSHHFAVEYKAGGRDKFKHFIRECHRRGIAVIQDVVYNHFTPDAGRAEWMFDSGLAERNQYYWYEGRASDYPSPEGGYVDNYSSGYAPRFHEEMVRAMFISSAVALVEEFHIDGFRVDLTDAIHSLNRRHADGAPVPAANAFGAKFLREWCRTLKLIRPDVMLMAEDHTGWDRVTAPPDQGGLGFDATWYSAFYHHLIGTLRQGLEWAGLLARAGTGGDEPLKLDYLAGALRASAGGHVVYHLSHDEAGNSEDTGRTMEIAVNRAPLEGETRRWAEKRSRLVAGLSLLSAGTPMFLMGEEVAASKPYTYKGWLSNREDLIEDRKPGKPGHHMFQFYSDLIRLRRKEPAFRSRHIDVVYVHEANRVIAFRRWIGDQHFLVFASFNNRPFADGYEFTNAALPDGHWEEVFNSDKALYNGDNVGNLGGDVPCWEGRFRAIIPAAGFVVFRHR